MVNFIESKDLGDLSAEHDKYLFDCFINEVPAFRSALDVSNTRCILLGRTGSGKSGIIRAIQEECNKDQDLICSSVNEDKHDFDYIVQATRGEFEEIPDEIESIIYKLSWHYTIIINMLRNKYPEGPLRSFKPHSDVDQIVYDFLSRVNSESILSSTITDLFILFVKNIKFKISGTLFGLGASVEVSKMNDSEKVKTYGRLLRSTESFIQKSLQKVIGGKRLYILIDDLDLDWNPNSDIQQRLMRALFNAINVYLRHPSIKPVIALRTDIFKSLKVHQREKYPDLITKVEWNNELLQGFIKQRILRAYGFNEKYQVLTHFFEGYIDGKNLIEYMIDYTLQRPRDLLELCKLAIEEAAREKSDRVREKHVNQALDEYSLNRVIALEDEWKLIYQNIEKLMELFAKYSNKKQIQEGFPPKEFLQVVRNIRDHLIDVNQEEKDKYPMWFLDFFRREDEEPTKLVTILYELGIFCIISNGTIYQQSIEEKPPTITTESILKIHPMFSRYLEKALLDEKNPWGL